MSKEILAKLIAKKAALTSPSITGFWDAERKAIFVSQGGDSSLESHMIHGKLTDVQLEAAYVGGSEKYQAASDIYYEQEAALTFAIEHYKGLVKIELALSLIEV